MSTPDPPNLWKCYLKCKGDFANVIKLRILMGGQGAVDNQALSMWSQGHQKWKRLAGERDTERQRQRKGETDLQCYSAGFEDRKAPATKEYRQLLEAEKRKETDCPQEPPEETQPCLCLDFFPVKPIQMSDLQNCEMYIVSSHYVCDNLLQIGTNPRKPVRWSSEYWETKTEKEQMIRKIFYSVWPKERDPEVL